MIGNAYLPSSLGVGLGLPAAAIGLLVVGYWLQRTTWRWAAWGVLLAVIAVTHGWLLEEGYGVRMVGLLWLSAYGMKTVVGVESRRATGVALEWWSWVVFAGAWFGMQPREFLERREQNREYTRRLARVGLAFVVAGVGTIYAAGWLLEVFAGAAWVGFVGIVGCSMVLHFGVIPLVAAGLRGLGFGVDRQFREPWLAVSLQEFWARRWNVGFSVMTSLAIYRPAAPVVGRNGALALGFVGSGLLHELGCSLPVRAGYGLPMVYFALHGVAVVIERWLQRKGLWRGGWLARVWVMGWVLVPVPLVFHAAFVDGLVRSVLG